MWSWSGAVYGNMKPGKDDKMAYYSDDNDTIAVF